jgi:hypothetical protein
MRKTISRLSNPFHPSLSVLPSSLFATEILGTPGNPELKAAAGSVEVTSGAVGCGALIALIAVFCVVVLFHRKHNRAQTEKTIDEFDLSTEHRNEEGSDVEEEHFFDLPNDGTDAEYLTESESWGDDRDFRIHYE